MSADPALILLDSKLGPIYESVAKSRRDVSAFPIKEMMDAIRVEKQHLLLQRGQIVKELSDIGARSVSTHSQFGRKLDDIERNIKDTLDSTKTLANTASQLSVDFAQITDRLDSATSIVSRAKSISQYISDIQVYNSSSSFEEVMKKLKNNEAFPLSDISKTAEYVAKLIKIVNISVKQGNIENAARNLRKHSDVLVATLTQEISGTDDPQMVRKYMQSLTALAPGDEPINNFISSTPYFTSVDGISLQYCEAFLQETYSNQINHYKALCKFIADQSKMLWGKIDVIFDRPNQVKHQILVKVCTRLLSDFVESILRNVLQENPKMFCQMLHSLYESSLQMFEDIWKIESQKFAVSSTYLDMIFMNHQRKYGELEISNLKEFLSSKVNPPLEKLERVQKQSAFKNMFKKTEDIINPFNVFNDEVPHEVLSSAKEAIVRCALLSPPEQISANLEEIISIFLEHSFNKYLIAHVKTCSFFLNQVDQYQNISNFIKLITLINSNVLSLEDAYKNLLKPILQPLSIVHNKFIKLKEKLIVSLETETVNGLSNCIELATNAARKILASKQKRQDFAPSNPNVEQTSTAACREFCKFANEILTDVNQLMFPDNAVNFLSRFVHSLKRVIVDHLLSFKYNNAGSYILMSDAVEYQSLFTKFDIERYTKWAMKFTSVIHLMTVPPYDLQKAIQDGPRLSTSTIKFANQMLKLRNDIKEIDIEGLRFEKDSK